MPFLFGENSWPQLQERIAKDPVVLLPVGQIEEHGRHLPVNTDEVIATQSARMVAEAARREGIPVLVMPSIWAGYSSRELAGWPGTIRVRARVVMDVVGDVCRSLIGMGLRKIVIMNAHGHHSALLQLVAREIGDETGVHIVATEIAVMAGETFTKVRKSVPGGAIHGGEFETSLMLYFNQPVNMSEVTDVDIMRYCTAFFPGDSFVSGKKVFWSTWGLQQSQTGIYGDPTVATRETGEITAHGMVSSYMEFLREYYNRGSLTAGEGRTDDA